jgi:hypothetical protein
MEEEMMYLKAWYKKLLIIWLCIGLPSIIIGIGFTGGSLSYASFDMRGHPLWEEIDVLAIMAFMLSPLILLPFGINLTSFKKNKK